jgi:hypothetical protein
MADLDRPDDAAERFATNAAGPRRLGDRVTGSIAALHMSAYGPSASFSHTPKRSGGVMRTRCAHVEYFAF